jgi:hypothetical protein
MAWSEAFIVMSIPYMWVRRRRPISASSEGIASYLFGRRFAFIPWSAVRIINKTLLPGRSLGRRILAVRVVGEHDEIFFSDLLPEYKELIGLVGSYAEEHKIKVLEKD